MKTKLLLVLSLTLTIHAYAGSATWNLNPTSGDWNTAVNWTPATVPNGPADTATFRGSDQKAVSIFADTEVSAIVFGPYTSGYTITASSDEVLTLSGTGIANNSGRRQHFVAASASATSIGGEIAFRNTARAGIAAAFAVLGGEVEGGSGGFIAFEETADADHAVFDIFGSTMEYASAGEVSFLDNSSANHAAFEVFAATAEYASQGTVHFLDNSTAGNASFLIHPYGVWYAGAVFFHDQSTAANATVTNDGGLHFYGTATAGSSVISNDGDLIFHENASAGQATINNDTDGSAAFYEGVINVWDSATAGDATITNYGGTSAGAFGGAINFDYSSPTAGNAILIAEAGINGGLGGTIKFGGTSDGGTARIEVFGNGNLDLSTHDRPGVTIGSLEGDGIVFLGGNRLIINENNLSTVFSGTVQDGGSGGGTHGSLTKDGMGTLTLTGANTYTGNTALFSGALLVNNTAGSGTGSGVVLATGGTLGGKGITSGAVTVGTGSGATVFLAPAFNSNKQVTLTLKSSLTLQTNASYTYTFKARTSQIRADLVQANGVTINSATIALQGKTQGTLTPGTVLTVISNTSANPISGTFSNLPDGAIVTVNGNNLQANYEGGDGNDLTLTVVS